MVPSPTITDGAEMWCIARKELPLQGGLVHELFEAQVERTPDGIAVVCEDERLTYAGLNGRANQLARHLRANGVARERPVALCLERSVDFIVAMLATLKAGGTFVPMDPTYPRQRLRFMVRDSAAAVVITHQRHARRLGDDGPPLVLLDADTAELDGHPDTDLGTTTTAGSLVYIIYTSGSTGTPKGVEVEHRHLTNYIRAICGQLDADVATSYAHVSSLAADLGYTVLFPSISTGGCLHIMSQERILSPPLYSSYGEPIDILKVTPSHLEALLTAPNPRAVLPRRQLIVGGEELHGSLLRRVRRLDPALRVMNHYGPTETTVGAATFSYSGGVDLSDNYAPPIGRPIANTRAYVLDDHLQPVPVGVPGELFIAGAGVARGYRNRPNLTADRFLHDPFVSTPDARMYRTGDRCRFLPDGNLEFLGRMDRQVKIRGFRIELGEIETTLRQHPDISDAAVLATDDRPGDIRLVGYYVPVPKASVSGEILSSFLSDRLPEYMIPPSWREVEALPLTANGKLDREALLAIKPVLTDTYEGSPLQSPTERSLAEIWEEILGIAVSSADSSFFDLGGHSLLVVKVTARIAQVFGIEIPLRIVYERSTIGALAREIDLQTTPPTAAASGSKA